MGGPPVNAKYIILAKFEVDGVAEKSDIIGAIFGQTEGMLGDDLDLRELQKIGKVGRIDVEYEVVGGKTYGTITIPTNLDKPEVALISAALETVDKVGPNYAKVELKEIKDLRDEKRKRIIDRAKEILLKWKETKEVDSEEIVKTLLESVRVSQIINYGEDKLPAGPEIDTANEIIIVEGRADVVNLLKHGYKNVIALNGSKVPPTIINLAKKKKTTIFVDGDRAGDLILKEVLQMVKVDYIARAPFGKEVEQLNSKEIANALANKISVSEYLQSLKTLKKIEPQITELVKSVIGTMEVIILDENNNIIERFPIRELMEKLNNIQKAPIIILDGIITQRLIDLALEKQVKEIYGYRLGNVTNIPKEISIYLFDERGIITPYEDKPKQ
jgi:DNA primase